MAVKSSADQGSDVASESADNADGNSSRYNYVVCPALHDSCPYPPVDRPYHDSDTMYDVFSTRGVIVINWRLDKRINKQTRH